MYTPDSLLSWLFFKLIAMNASQFIWRHFRYYGAYDYLGIKKDYSEILLFRQLFKRYDLLPPRKLEFHSNILYFKI